MLERQTWQQSQCSEVEKASSGKEDSGLKHESDDSREEQVSDEQNQDSVDEKIPMGIAGAEVNSCDHEEDLTCSAEASNRLEHLHQIFVTKNHLVLRSSEEFH
ncbi:hypothetical protein TURU_129797 [Turdus rufiventris]|nr:hypothetical protein TURU_129797 [Turdus rufiventris]